MRDMHKSSRKSMLTYIIILLNIAVYAYTSVISGDFIETNYDVILQYGQVNLFVIHYGWYWQLFTAMLVHVNMVHLLGNMFFLLIFGLRAEQLFTIQEYLLVYFLSGLAGNLFTLLFGPVALPSAGASGAIVRPEAVDTLRKAVAAAYPLCHPAYAKKFGVHECKFVDGIKVFDGQFPV